MCSILWWRSSLYFINVKCAEPAELSDNENLNDFFFFSCVNLFGVCQSCVCDPKNVPISVLKSVLSYLMLLITLVFEYKNSLRRHFLGPLASNQLFFFSAVFRILVPICTASFTYETLDHLFTCFRRKFVAVRTKSKLKIVNLQREKIRVRSN